MRRPGTEILGSVISVIATAAGPCSGPDGSPSHAAWAGGVSGLGPVSPDGSGSGLAPSRASGPGIVWT